jgi:hypothetical protein
MPKEPRRTPATKGKTIKNLTPKPKATGAIQGGATKHPAKVTVPDIKWS